MIADINNVYTCCDLYIVFRIGFLLIKVYSEFVSTIKVDVIVEDDLDYCKYTDNRF